MKTKKIFKTVWKALVIIIAISMVLSMAAIGF
jgi:LPS O-antigen subunit length determinant protein (WzzB/FepE family)